VKNAVHVYTTVVPPESGAAWKAVLLVQSSSGRVLAEDVQRLTLKAGVLTASGSAASTAALAAMLQGLMVAKRIRARNVVVFSDRPRAIDALSRQTQVAAAAVGTYLQLRAMAHSFASVEFRYAPYPAISDLPVMAAGG
jgi:hypothetical protein